MRSRGIGVQQIFGKLAAFFSNNVNPLALTAIGWKFFAIYCGWIAFEVMFQFFFYPETYGRTLEELAFRKLHSPRWPAGRTCVTDTEPPQSSRTTSSTSNRPLPSRSSSAESTSPPCPSRRTCTRRSERPSAGKEGPACREGRPGCVLFHACFLLSVPQTIVRDRRGRLLLACLSARGIVPSAGACRLLRRPGWMQQQLRDFAIYHAAWQLLTSASSASLAPVIELGAVDVTSVPFRTIVG